MRGQADALEGYDQDVVEDACRGDVSSLLDLTILGCRGPGVRSCLLIGTSVVCSFS